MKLSQAITDDAANQTRGVCHQRGQMLGIAGGRLLPGAGCKQFD